MIFLDLITFTLHNGLREKSHHQLHFPQLMKLSSEARYSVVGLTESEDPSTGTTNLGLRLRELRNPNALLSWADPNHQTNLHPP